MKARSVIALCLVMAMVLCSFAGCAQVRAAGPEETKGSDTEDLVKSVQSLVLGHGAEEGKEETVYVITGADGSVEKTIVSVWLKNPEEAATLSDHAELTDIKNVKGDETYTDDGKGNLTWDAQGRDIYYEGVSTTGELPVAVSVSYRLDGKSVTAEELAGASGKLEMTFSYENKVSKVVEIDGKKETIYAPFVVVSGLILDNEVASDITVTNGKILADGQRSVVVGMAMPGLQESLGLENLTDEEGKALDIAIPETVTVTAQVTNFSLTMALTLVQNGFLSQVDLDKVSTMDELEEAMTSLTDASTQLVEGSKSLYDGAEQLADGTKTLQNGVDSLYAGADALNDGASSLASGTVLLKEGAASLAVGSGSLYAGLQSLQSGAADLNDGLGRLQTSVKDLPGSAAMLFYGAKGLRAALQSGDPENPGIQEGAKAISAGAARMEAGLISGDEENPGVYEGAAAISDGAKAIAQGAVSGDPENPGIYEGAALVKEGLGALPQSVGTATAALDESQRLNGEAEKLLQTLLASGTLSETQTTAIQGALQYIQGSDQYQAGVSKSLSALPDSLTGANAALDAIQAGAQRIQAGAQAIDAGAGKISAGAQELYAGAQGIDAGGKTISAGVDTMFTGNDGNNLDAMIAGLRTLNDSSAELVSGVSQLTDGSKALKNGTDSAVTGAGQLAGGSQQLSGAAGQVKDGAQQLYAGASSLVAGVGTLQEGTGTLAQGMDTLLSGAKELMEGMAKFDAEGISKVADLFQGDAETLIDRLRAIRELDGSYTSFSGEAKDMPTTVKFIYRMDSIGE